MKKNAGNDYSEFLRRFKLFATKRPDIVVNTLSNIFSMRKIGNKTHGDMAEVGMVEFINQFMYDYHSEHVGKDLFRKKEHEEDIVVFSELCADTRIPVSLKAYGDGPLQLSTDKDAAMFPELQKHGDDITDSGEIVRILHSGVFSSLDTTNVMPLIYREDRKQCNIMVFDFPKMEKDTARIVLIGPGQKYDFETGSVVAAKGRKHPVYKFLNADGDYVCEVRYGGAASNALQRGLWTHTVNAESYFDSLTNGWIDYKHSDTLVRLFRLALNASGEGHRAAAEILQEDINKLLAGNGGRA